MQYPINNLLSSISIILMSIIALSSNLGAQSIQPSVISSGGSIGNHCFTIGESFVQTIGSNSKITQGFHQSYLVKTSVDDQTKSVIIEIYPNPFLDQITVSTEYKRIQLKYTIYNQNGELVSYGSLTSSEQQLDCSNFIAGSYYIILQDDNNVVHRSKLIKI